MKKKLMFGAVCAVLLCMSGGALVAKIVYVNEDYVELRSDKGGWSEPVLTLHKGAALQVLEGENDPDTSYYKVSVTDADGTVTEGYVYKELVADEKPGDSFSASPGYFGGAEASQEGETAAAKGLSPVLEQYIKDTNGNIEAVRFMDTIPRQITSDEMQEFMKDGGIGVYQDRQRQGGEK